MKFDFCIQNHDEENETLLVRFTPEDQSLGSVQMKFSIDPGEGGGRSRPDDILQMIRKNAPLQYWRKKVRARGRTAEDLKPISDLIGYEEIGVEGLAASVKEDPRSFPQEGVI